LSAPERGYTGAWHRAAKAFLAIPENRHCACGCGGIATVVDHRIPHKGDMRLFWDRSNWQPMTKPCNSAKAAREEGGFGNARPMAPAR
jgi:5-methylcytosine-specific restriction endonuclease McrA